MKKNLSGGKYKRVLREHVATLVKPKMTIFSLPYLNFEIEGKAKKAICCEMEKRTYQLQQKKAPKNCVLHHGMASDIIGNYVYDLAFLDLCGSLSKEFFLCLERVKLKPRGRLVITLLKAREHEKWTHLMKNGRISGYSDILLKYGFHLYKTIEYYDTSPMIVLFANQTPHKHVVNFKIQ